MKDITKRWVEYAEKDLEAAQGLLGAKCWQHCVLNCHQAIEKILKAVIIEQDKEPKKIHNLVTLLQNSKLQCPQQFRKYIEQLSPHYLPARYPDVRYKMRFIYNQRVAGYYLRKSMELFNWIGSELEKR